MASPSPSPQWAAFGLPLLLFAGAILLLRRLAGGRHAGSPFLRGPLKGRDIAYLAWFGPVGIAAIYYAAYAQNHVGDERLWPIASAAIFASMVAHGMTAYPLTRLYARD